MSGNVKEQILRCTSHCHSCSSLCLKIIFISMISFCISQPLCIGEGHILFFYFTNEKTKVWKALLICSRLQNSNLLHIQNRLFIPQSKIHNCFSSVSVFKPMPSIGCQATKLFSFILYSSHMTISVFLHRYNFPKCYCSCWSIWLKLAKLLFFLRGSKCFSVDGNMSCE